MMGRPFRLATLLVLLAGLMWYRYPWIITTITERFDDVSVNWSPSIPSSATVSELAKPSQETLKYHEGTPQGDHSKVLPQVLVDSSTKEEEAGRDDSEASPGRKRLRELPAPREGEQMDGSLADGSVQLDTLGPIVVNADGTLSRIANWNHMTEAERLSTLKRLSKRNKERIARLKEEEGITDPPAVAA